MFSRKRDAVVVDETPVAAREAATEVDLTSQLGPLTLANPVMTASGCASNGRELHNFFDVSALGAFVTKTVLADPRSGRGTPRMAETPSGMLNSIGLQGPGIEAFCEKDLAWLASVGTQALVSVGGNDAREYAQVAQTLLACEHAGAVAGIELNISCPNVANRGLVFACDPVSAAEVTERVRRVVGETVPLFVKLSADVTDLVEIARSVVHAGADGLTMINTLLGIEIDTVRMHPHLAGVTGGLSGPAVRPVGVRAVWQVANAMRDGRIPPRPIIGVGGVRTGADALQYLAAGAAAVQVGTAVFNDPHAPVRVIEELAAELDARGYTTVSEVVGAALPLS
ncbi:Dihydroorotate dehydrogenase B (NAD(+)), catalytic subunit [Dermatophilus congolensis]|uniref:Dihydroorotate dehydrogenase n=1 Tax=Dermatophilus congolensis TaxID=1863 RepID=A0AA46BM88_9MICO|nr:dihydroorotate dehydrogenase [Dermatophilus congolensis]STD06581.1 Dihydroorotate dehydrogenase B (NAD(+)), catalytic subunit [Dermatophilus congolensis]